MDASAVHSGDFQEWADESYQMAKDFVYPDFVEHVVPTEEYKETRLPLLEERMVLGGARLAALIEEIYSDSTVVFDATQ